MRVKIVRGRDDRTVHLVYPATLDEYAEAIAALGRVAGAFGDGRPVAGSAGHGLAQDFFVVTTAEQRYRWELPDLAVMGRARVVDEGEALGLLCDAMASFETGDEPPAAAPAAAAPPPDGGRCRPALPEVRALVDPGACIDQVLASLESAGLPRPVAKMLRRQIRRALASRAQALDEVLQRAGRVLSLPWRAREAQRFDRAHVAQALERTHGGLARVKARLLDLLAACPQTRGPLTVENPRRGVLAETQASVLVVRPAPSPEPVPAPCLTGPRGTGKTSLAVAVAEALGRSHVRVTVGVPNAAPVVRGVAGRAAGRIIEGLREAGVANPVFFLEAIDQVEAEAADALLDVLEPARAAAFRDAHVDVPFDLTGVVWIVTATDPDKIPEPVRKRLEVIALPWSATETSARPSPASTPGSATARPRGSASGRSAGTAPEASCCASRARRCRSRVACRWR